MSLAIVIDVAVGTVVLGSIYTLVALGYVYIFRSTGVINFAHGELLTLGAWITLSLIGTGLQHSLGIVTACLAVGIIAAVGYQFVVRPVETNGLFVAVTATMGIAFMLDGIMLAVWGTAPHALPILAGGSVIFLPGAGVSTANVEVAVIAIILYAVVVLADRYFLVGVQMRAAAADKVLASQSGIRVGLLFIVAWIVAGGLAAAAGIAYAGTTLVSPLLTTIGVAGLPAALIGGFDSVEGALPGAFLIAFTVICVEIFVNSAASLAVMYALLLLFVMFRPQGLFGSVIIDRV